MFRSLLVLGERPRPREMTGLVLSISGVMLLLARFEGAALMGAVSSRQLGTALAAVAVSIGVLLAISASDRIHKLGIRAVAMGGAAGLAQGMSDAMNRVMGAWLSPEAGWIPSDFMGITATVFLALFGFAGLAAAQNALKSFRANTVVPCMLTMQLLVPVVMSLVLFGQDIPSGAVHRAVWVAALVLTLSGVITLSTSPRVASKSTVPAGA